MNLNFDLNLLVVFNALFETRSATLAGKKLGRTQSAISNSLKKLRQAMNDPLFMRGSNGLVPTARAEEIQGQVRLILDSAGVCLNGTGIFDPQTSAGRTRIGAPDRLSLPVMFPLIKKVLVEAPGISLHLQTTDREHALGLLKDDVIDLAVGWFSKPPSQFNSRFLFQENLVCLCRTGHPILKGGSKLTLENLMRYPHLVVSSAGDRKAAFDEILARDGISRQVAVSANNFSAVPNVLQNSDLVGVFTHRVSNALAGIADLAMAALSMDIEPLDHYMVWSKRLETDPKHQWIRNQLADVANS